MSIFATTSAFIASHKRPGGYTAGDIIRTQGFTSKGDRGSGRWKATGNVIALSQSPSDLVDAKMSDASGNEFELVFSILRPLKIGAIGDDAANDTAAILAAVAGAAGRTLDLGDTSNIYLSDTITVSSGLTVVSTGGSLKSRTDQDKLLIVAANDTILDSVVFDGNDFEVDNNLVSVNSGLTGWKILDCTTKNIKGVTGVDQYGLKINGDDCEGEVRNLICKDISNFNPTQTPTSAFNGGIVVLLTATGAKQLIINGTVCDNIFTDNIAGSIDNSDSDGIRIVGVGASPIECGIDIGGLDCTGVQKSALKVSGAKGLKYADIFVDGTRTDLAMIAGVRFQESNDSIGSNVKLKGFISRGVNISSSNFLLNGLHYSPVGVLTMDSSLISQQDGLWLNLSKKQCSNDNSNP